GGGALAPNGSKCTQASECTSKLCVDGRCCNSSCNGQCEACDVASMEGSCVPVVGAPHKGGTPTRSACNGSGACQGTCGNGVASSCQFPTSNTPCGTPSCVGTAFTPVG